MKSKIRLFGCGTATDGVKKTKTTQTTPKQRRRLHTLPAFASVSAVVPCRLHSTPSDTRLHSIRSSSTFSASAHPFAEIIKHCTSQSLCCAANNNSFSGKGHSQSLVHLWCTTTTKQSWISQQPAVDLTLCHGECYVVGWHCVSGAVVPFPIANFTRHADTMMTKHDREPRIACTHLFPHTPPSI